MQEDVSPQQVDILRESGHEHFSGNGGFPGVRPQATQWGGRNRQAPQTSEWWPIPVLEDRQRRNIRDLLRLFERIP